MSYYSHYDIDVLINNRPAKLYSHNGKIFVEAKNGSEYTLKFRNQRTLQRVLLVTSVDGINVIDGQPAGASKVGYVVNGFTNQEIKGFRVSNDTVNAFKFSSKEESYVAKSDVTDGDTSSCGVIGFRIYAEKIKPLRNNIWRIPYQHSLEGEWTNSVRPLATKSVDISYCANVSDAPQFDMGTAFSEIEIPDRVTEVDFEIGELISQIEIHYASRQALIAMGVPIEKENKIAFPKAFPSKFCKPPAR